MKQTKANFLLLAVYSNLSRILNFSVCLCDHWDLLYISVMPPAFKSKENYLKLVSGR